jgi:hypothetical protein
MKVKVKEEHTDGVSLTLFGERGSSVPLSFLSSDFLFKSFPSSPFTSSGTGTGCPSFQVISWTFLLTSPTFPVSSFFDPEAEAEAVEGFRVGNSPFSFVSGD